MEFYYRFAIYGYSSDESLIVVRNTRHIQILRLISGLEQDDLTLPIKHNNVVKYYTLAQLRQSDFRGRIVSVSGSLLSITGGSQS